MSRHSVIKRTAIASISKNSKNVPSLTTSSFLNISPSLDDDSYSSSTSSFNQIRIRSFVSIPPTFSREPRVPRKAPFLPQQQRVNYKPNKHQTYPSSSSYYDHQNHAPKGYNPQYHSDRTSKGYNPQYDHRKSWRVQGSHVQRVPDHMQRNQSLNFRKPHKMTRGKSSSQGKSSKSEGGQGSKGDNNNNMKGTGSAGGRCILCGSQTIRSERGGYICTNEQCGAGTLMWSPNGTNPNDQGQHTLQFLNDVSSFGQALGTKGTGNSGSNASDNNFDNETPNESSFFWFIDIIATSSDKSRWSNRCRHWF